MPKFNFQVEVAGAVEAWEMEIWIKNCFNGSSGRPKGIILERCVELDPLKCYHGEGCDCYQDE